jgi:hypothetical protein
MFIDKNNTPVSSFGNDQLSPSFHQPVRCTRRWTTVHPPHLWNGSNLPGNENHNKCRIKRWCGRKLGGVSFSFFLLSTVSGCTLYKVGTSSRMGWPSTCLICFWGFCHRRKTQNWTVVPCCP